MSESPGCSRNRRGGSSITEPLAKVTTEEDRDEAGPTKASDISEMRELGYFSGETNSRTYYT